MKHPEHFYIVTDVLASSGGKSISELKFQYGVTMSGRNLSKTPNLYYVKRGYFICTRNDSVTYKEGDTFTVEPGENFILTSMDHSILLEFESSVPEFHKVPSPANNDSIYTKLWVKCRPETLYTVNPLK